MGECHKIVELRQEDFEKGPVTITESNTVYRLKEDIIFDPVVAPWKINPYNPLNSGCPHKAIASNAAQKDKIAATCPKNRTNFKLGFPAAIIILCDGVVIDLNGHSIRMSKKFYVFQRFYSHIQIGASPFETSKGPAPTFNTFDIFPSDITITSSCGRGVLGLTSHTSIMAIGNMKNTVEVSKIDFVDNEVGAGIFNLCGGVKIESCTIDNCRLVVPINGNFSGLIQNLTKLEVVLNSYDQWFSRLRRENEGDDAPIPNCDLNDLYQQQEKCLRELIDLMRNVRTSCSESHYDVATDVVNKKIEHLLNLKRMISVLIYSGNWPENYPVDVTWDGANEETREANATLPYRQDVINTVENFRKLLKTKVAFEDMIEGVNRSLEKTKYYEIRDPTLSEFYNPLGDPDGSAYYGFSFVNSQTPGVGDFQDVNEEDRFGHIEVKNVKMQNIKLSPIEVPGIEYKGEVNNDQDPNNDVEVPVTDVYSSTSTLKTMAGEILYMVDPSRPLPFFANRVHMADAINRQNNITTRNNEFNNSIIFPDISGLTGTLSIDDDEMISTLKNIVYILKKVSDKKCLPSYIEFLDGIRSGIAVLKNSDLIGDVGSGSRYVISLNQDVMQHKPKGIICLKIEGLKSIDLNNIHIENLKNTGLDYNRSLGGVSTFDNHSLEYIYEGTHITGMLCVSSGNCPNGPNSNIRDFVFKNVDIEADKVYSNRFRFFRKGVETVISYSDDNGLYDRSCEDYCRPKPPCHKHQSISCEKSSVHSCNSKSSDSKSCGSRSSTSDDHRSSSNCHCESKSEQSDHSEQSGHSKNSNCSKHSDYSAHSESSDRYVMCLCSSCKRRRKRGEHPPNYYTKDKCNSKKSGHYKPKCPSKSKCPVRLKHDHKNNKCKKTVKSHKNKVRRRRDNRYGKYGRYGYDHRYNKKHKSSRKCDTSSSSSSSSSHKSRRYCRTKKDARKRRLAVSLIKDLQNPAKNIDLINALL